jgi:hypothetical protein
MSNQANMPAKLKPSGIWYLIGSLLIAVGIAGFITLLVVGLQRTSKAVDNFARFVVPKEGTEAKIRVDQPGTYTLYYEFQSKVDGVTYKAAQDVPADLKIVAKTEVGDELPVTPAPTEVNFSFSGTAGHSVSSVRIPAPGTFVVRVTGGNATAPYVVSMGKGVLGRLAGYVLGGLAIGAIGGLGGLATLIVTGVRRRNNRRTQLAAAAASPFGTSWGQVGSPPPPIAPPGVAPWSPAAPTAAPAAPVARPDAAVPAPAWSPSPPIAPPPPAAPSPAAPPARPSSVPPPAAPAPVVPTPASAPVPPPAWSPPPPAIPASADGADADDGRVAPPTGPWTPPPPPPAR